MRSETANSRVIGYLVSEYPSRSHTFIRREIEALEKKNLKILRYSQRKSAREDILNAEEEREYERTFSVFPLRIIRYLRCHILSMMARPGRYTKSLFLSVRRRPVGRHGVLRAFAYFFQGVVLAEKLRNDNIGFLHIHFINSGMHVGAVAACYNGIAWGVSIHGRSDFDYPCVESLPWVARQSEFVRCISHFGASQAKRIVEPRFWNRIFVCYSGIPGRFLENPNRHSGKNGNAAVLISVGRLAREKGLPLLLELAINLDKAGQAFELRIVGDGPERKLLESDVRDGNLQQKVHFLGPMDEGSVLQEMADADCYVCTSLMEGLPQVLLEAMAKKLPVVAPWLTGIPEAINHEETGLLYYCGDPVSLTEAVKKMLGNPPRSTEMANNAFRFLESRFTLERSIEPLVRRIQSASGTIR